MFLSAFHLFILVLQVLAFEAKKEVCILHPQLSWILDHHSDFKKHYTKIEPLQRVSDPHGFEPTTSDIKKIYHTDILLTGPITHTPWIRPLLKKKAQNKIFIVHDELDHFWLNSQSLCLVEKKLLHFLNLKPSQTSCLKVQVIQEKIKDQLKKKNYSVVITHPSLNQLFAKLSIEHFSLATSNHHHEVKPKRLKEFLKWKEKQKNILWIVEKGHTLPPTLKGKNKTIINFSPYKKEKAHPLEQLLNKLRSF